MTRSRWLLLASVLVGCGEGAPRAEHSADASEDRVARDVAEPDANRLDVATAADAEVELDASASMDASIAADTVVMDAPSQDQVAIDSRVDARPDLMIDATMDARADARADAATGDVAADRAAPDGAVVAPVVLPAHYASLRTAQVWADVATSPASITVRWASVTGRAVTAVTIDRKPLAATSWTQVATPSGALNAWTDNTAVAGELYEYRVRLNAPGITAYGYVASGVRAETDGYRGRIALVVDESLRPMLGAELATLEADLFGDGWIPVVLAVPRAATPTTVRNQLVALRAMHADLSAAFLIGHVPVAYAGPNNPDGHGGGRVMGADGFYAELTSTWRGAVGCANSPEQATLTDAPSMTNTFCEGDLPSTVELAVGRVDTSNLPQYAMSEIALLREYLSKAHRYKTRQWAAQQRAFIKDALETIPLATGFGAWSTYGALVGPRAIQVDNSSSTFLYQLLDRSSYLFAFGSYFGASCGGSVNGVVGSTATVSSRAWGAVFNHTIGSYFGEHNCRDGYLRGLLLSGDALAHGYNALHWWFHPMAMGQPVALSVTRTMNNKLTNLYAPLGSSIASTNNTHLGFMGDPTLRAQYILPPSALTLSNVGGRVEARWTASGEAGIDGYHVYQVTASGWTRLTAAPIAATSLRSSVVYAPGTRFVVRAIKLTVTPSGSYFLPSVGATAVTS